MKRIINGLTYNTDTASIVARYTYQDEDNCTVKATVYQTRGGALFIAHEWEEGVDRHFERVPVPRPLIEALDQDALVKQMERADDFEIVDPSVLKVREAATESKAEATIYVRVPEALKRRLDEAAKAQGQSTNAYVTRCLERCMRRPAEQGRLGL